MSKNVMNTSFAFFRLLFLLLPSTLPTRVGQGQGQERYHQVGRDGGLGAPAMDLFRKYDLNLNFSTFLTKLLLKYRFFFNKIAFRHQKSNFFVPF